MVTVVNDPLQHKGPMLRSGTAVDAALISAPSSSKSVDGERDWEIKQTKKGNNWYFGMKANISADVVSGLVHGGDHADQCQEPRRRRAMRPGLRCQLNPFIGPDQLLESICGWRASN